MQIHWEQTQVLESEAYGASEGDRKHGQVKDGPLCSTHHELSKHGWEM